MTLKYQKTREYTLLLLIIINLQVTYFDISNLVKNSGLSTKLATLATKAEIKAEQDKIVKLKTFDLSYFLDIFFLSDDGSQNMFVYQPTLNTLKLKEGKGTDHILSWRSKGVYTSKFKPLYTAFLHSIKLSGYRIRIKFDKDQYVEK